MTRRPAAEEWKLAWQHAFFALLLTVQLTRPDVFSVASSSGRLTLSLALLGGLVGWYAYWFWWRTRVLRPSLVPYLVGAAVLWLALVAVHPGFWFAGFAVLVPLGMRQAVPTAVAVATCGGLWLASRLTRSEMAWPEVAAWLLTIAAGIMFLGYLAAVDREAARRARLLDELATAQAELAASERRAGTLTGTLAERQRLAREVHDTLTQGFASIAMLLEAVQEERNASTADRHIATALRTARHNLTESRRLVWDLQPSCMDGASLADAVRRQTRQLADDTGVATHTVVTGEPTQLDQRTEVGVLRVVQEALTNARRHARATTITVTLSHLPEMLLVDIQDDGIGMPIGQQRAGMGLRVMRQRADELGGTVIVESEPGEGTTIVLIVPARTAQRLGAGA